MTSPKSLKETKPKPKGTSGDLTGRIHWSLTILEIRDTAEDVWVASCKCGKMQLITRKKFFSSRSCGCHKVEKKFSNRKFVKGTPEFSIHRPLTAPEKDAYNIWEGMWERCSNKNSWLYRDYGARGIKVSKRWTSFFNFYSDMGPRPSKDYSIERTDVNKGYVKTNCIWLLRSLQSRNTRRTVRVKVNGELTTLIEVLEQNPHLERKDFRHLNLKEIPEVSHLIDNFKQNEENTRAEFEAWDKWLASKLKEINNETLPRPLDRSAEPR